MAIFLYLTIKSDTGQHSQFLRCFFKIFRFPKILRFPKDLLGCFSTSVVFKTLQGFVKNPMFLKVLRCPEEIIKVSKGTLGFQMTQFSGTNKQKVPAEDFPLYLL